MALLRPMVRNRVPWRERYRVSKKITGQSFRLMRTIRPFWVFPLLSGLVMGVFTIILFGMNPGSTGGSGRFLPGLGIGHPVIEFAILMAAGFPMMVFMALMNSALVYGVYRELSGRPVSVRFAWRRTLAQIGPILRWSLIGLVVGNVISLVGMFLDHFRLIPGVGYITQVVGAMGWATASFFVLPIIMVDREWRAMQALKRSVGVAKDNWGKSIAGLTTITLAIMVPSIVVMMALMMLASMVLPFVLTLTGVSFETLVVVLPFVVTAGFVALLVVGVTLANVGFSTYQTGLYLYAKTGQITGTYTKETLVDAWEPYRSS